MTISLLFLFKDGARSDDEPVVRLDGDEGHLIPLVTDRVVLSDGAWHVEERFFRFGEGSLEVQLLLGRGERFGLPQQEELKL